MAKLRKSVRHSHQIISTGGHCKKKKHKIVNLGGEGTNNQFTTQLKFYIRAVYIFWKKSFTEVLNFSKLSIFNNCEGKSFQSFGARQANVFSPNLLFGWRKLEMIFCFSSSVMRMTVSSHINFRAYIIWCKIIKSFKKWEGTCPY